MYTYYNYNNKINQPSIPLQSSSLQLSPPVAQQPQKYWNHKIPPVINRDNWSYDSDSWAWTAKQNPSPNIESAVSNFSYGYRHNIVNSLEKPQPTLLNLGGSFFLPDLSDDGAAILQPNQVPVRYWGTSNY